MGKLSHFLEIEVHRDATGLYLTQTKYATYLLKRIGYESLKPSQTPMAAGKLISKTQG